MITSGTCSARNAAIKSDISKICIVSHNKNMSNGMHHKLMAKHP